MRSSKRTDKRRLLSHIRALCNDPDFVVGAKEMLASKPKPFNYNERRNNQAQINYEVGRQIAIRALQSSLCFLIMLALWAIPALAQQRWWVLARSVKIGDALLDTCKSTGEMQTPGDFSEPANTAGSAPQIIDKGDEVDVIYAYQGDLMQNRYFRTQESCQKAAQANIDAANAEKAKMDKYR
jgi:hypothetical protein